MPVTVATPNNVPAATGLGQQEHLFYAENSGRWWLLWIDSTAGTSLKSMYSSDRISWTAGATITLPNPHDSEGRNLSAKYKNISGNDIVHMTIWVEISATSHIAYHSRGAISGTTLSWSTIAAYMTDNNNFIPEVVAIGNILDSANRPNNFIAIFGDMNVIAAANTDSGSSWTAGFGGNTTIEFSVSQFSTVAAFALASQNMLVIGDLGATNGTTYTTLNLHWWRYNGSSWSSGVNVRGSDLGTAMAKSDWTAVDRSVTDIHLVLRNGNQLEHYRYNGTSFSSVVNLPAQVSKAGSGLFMATDGTDVWLFVIDSGAGNNVKYCQWSGGSGTWGSWQTLVGTSATRNYISGYRNKANGVVGVIWTEGSATPFDIKAEFLTFTPPTPQPPFRLGRDTLGGSTLRVLGGTSVSGSFTVNLSGAVSPSSVLVRQDNRRYTGATSPAGAIIRNAQRAWAGAISPSGVVSRRANLGKTGAISPTGVLTRRTQWVRPGILSLQGTIVKSDARSLAATLTSAGVLSRRVGIVRAGSISPTAVVSSVRAVLKAFGGATGPSGVLRRDVSALRAGSVGPIGSIQKIPATREVGALTPLGTRASQVNQARSGQVGMSGQVQKALPRAFSGVLTSSGIVRKVSGVLKGGSVAPGALQRLTGALTRGGTLTLSAVVTRTGGRRLSGTVAPAGQASWLPLITRAGAITPAGIVRGFPRIVRTANLNQTGVLVRSTLRSFASAISTAGSVTRQTGKRLQGSLSLSGAAGIVRQAIATTINLAGALSPSGTLRRQAQPIRAGVLSLAGTVSRRTQWIRGGTLSPAGTTTRRIQLVRAGVIAPTGQAFRALVRFVSGVLTSSGVLRRQPQAIRAGTIAPVGAIRRSVSSALAGSIGPIGSRIVLVSRRFAGSIAPVGAVSLLRALIRYFGGAISFAGSLRKTATRTTGGALAPIGSLVSRANLALDGAIVLVGNVSRALSFAVEGAIGFSGSLSRSLVRNIFLAGSLVPQGVAHVAQVIDLGWHFVKNAAGFLGQKASRLVGNGAGGTLNGPNGSAFRGIVSGWFRRGRNG